MMYACDTYMYIYFLTMNLRSMAVFVLVFMSYITTIFPQHLIFVAAVIFNGFVTFHLTDITICLLSPLFMEIHSFQFYLF